MYYNHNLRTNIQEWKNRLYRSTEDNFGNQVKFCLNNIENNKILKSILNESVSKYSYDRAYLENISKQMEYGRAEFYFNNESEHASFCYQILNFIIELDKTYNLHYLTFFQKSDFEDIKKSIIEDFISPIFYYFHDQLEKSSSVIYLLEKYKRRTEWFTGNVLIEKYKISTKNYEQILEDDLRLFIFDQGIDFPFSTPKSTSGRADIIGAIDTSDPLVIEIKIFDRNKNYGKNRIIEGFSQIVKYTNDYNKDIGYLVIFNMDKAEINFQLNENNKVFPPIVNLNNKTYCLIVINLNNENSASKIGTTELITIKEDELTK